MQDEKLTSRITYDGFMVISARKLNKILFIKTYDLKSGEIYWFLGFTISNDVTTDIKRVLAEGNKYSNEYFKQMFANKILLPPKSPLIIDESTTNFDLTEKRKRIAK